MGAYDVMPELRLPESLVGHGKHIRQAANSTAAEIMALTEQERAHLIVDLARAVVALDPRVDLDP